MSTIGFVGAGNMAEALVKGIIAANIYARHQVLVSDIRPERVIFVANKYGLVVARTNAEIAERAETIVLSVKPQNMDEALQSIKDAVKKENLVISIAAGIRTARISAVLGDIPIVRAMPNTPALIGQGACALFANDKAKPMLQRAKSIFSAVGKTVVVDDEDLIDAVTAVSGSGPAYYFLLMEEMIRAGIELGLSSDIAKDLVLQTAKGAALLAVESDKQGETPAVLRQKVTSPGGTTEAALGVLAQGEFGQLLSAAIKQAHQRSRQLSK
jgi:pyrroline-5-carboxylate reductase